MDKTIIIRPMEAADAPTLARCHKQGLPTAFLSRFDVGFLAHLYQCISASKHGMVLVAVSPDGRIAGFISGATDIGKVYREMVLRRGWLMAALLWRYLLNVGVLRRLFQTLLYPWRVQKTYPKAELLSIVVDPEFHGTGVARDLLGGLIQAFENQGCRVFKVLVGSGLARANAFYLKHGFRLVDTVESHGVPSNIYVFETRAEARPA